MSNTKKLLIEYNALCPNGICQDFLTEDEKRLVKDRGAIFLTGIVQKADTKNGNGRIYPKKILEREVEKYKQLIQEKRAVGECVDEETQILTSEGWKFLRDISETEKVFTLNLQNHQLELQQIERKIVLPFDGEMYHIKNKNSIDQMITPNHKVLLINRKLEPIYMTADEVYTQFGSSPMNHCHFLRAGAKWQGEDPEYFELPETNIKIKSELWAAFLGIFLSEGYCNKSNKYAHGINIYQKKEPTKTEIRNLLKELPFELTESVRTSDPNYTTFFVKSKELKKYLLQFGLAENKFIPQEIKNWCPKLLNILFEWLLKGDGRNRKLYNKKTKLNDRIGREYYTISKQLAHDVFEIIIKLGSSASMQIRIQKSSYIKDHYVPVENMKPLYVVCENTTRGAFLSTYASVEMTKIPYKGNVYCVTTSNGNWFMRRNDRTCWTGNCDHSESEVVELKNVSHLITDLWWGDDGMTLYGKLKILNTPMGNTAKGLIEDGVQLGISSRALGSLTKSRGNSIVNEDLSIISWDIVSLPSTPGAFLKPMNNSSGINNANELSSYLRENQNKINNLITEILRKQ